MLWNLISFGLERRSCEGQLMVHVYDSQVDMIHGIHGVRCPEEDNVPR